MDERINKIAALANVATYNDQFTKSYIDGAPHIKHESLRMLFGGLLVKVFDEAKKRNASPRVLDIGAGEGTVTLSFLELGARVVATDISKSQLDALQKKCERFGDLLQVRCEDVSDMIRNNTDCFDVVVASSFLHHVPDYLGMIEKLQPMLGPRGQFFSFQDPLRYNSLGKTALFFSSFSYYFWRLFKGDLIGGLKRWIRRKRGIYLQDCPFDNAEYHVGRGGVDQDAIRSSFKMHGFDCEIISYFSTQNGVFNYIGERFGFKNTFAVIATRAMQ